MPVLFLNAKTEAPDALTCHLVHQIALMRESHSKRIAEVAGRSMN
jgi:hypothetical protein